MTKDPVDEWLSNINSIPTATDDSLRRSLLTPDGRGSHFKELCLNEMLKRAKTGVLDSARPSPELIG